MADPVPFLKYEQAGAYHWTEADRTAKRYNPALDARYRIILRPVGARDVVLDIGCGDGYLLHLASGRAGRVVGIDSEKAAVTLAGPLLREAVNVRVTQGSAYELPFRDGCFDVVLMADVIEHLEDATGAVRECSRVLRTGGRLLVTTPKWRPDRTWDATHVKEYTPAELGECLGKSFSDVHMTFFWPLAWSNAYATKAGWRLVRALARYVYNPFLREGTEPEKYGQIFAVCRK
jgi:SAM-dependent methyltransferase